MLSLLLFSEWRVAVVGLGEAQDLVGKEMSGELFF